MTVPSDNTSGSSSSWLFKNKEHGKTSAAASLVCIHLLPGFSLIYLTCMLDSHCLFVITEYDFTVGC
jgi:hypothetical protein